MRLLALDTSTRYAGIALSSDDDVGSDYGEYTWHTGNNHNVDLLDSLRRLLAERDVTFQELDGICVATGPGSFNGVRIAVAVAKTLAYTLGIPLLGISTLDVIAAQQRLTTQLLCATLEAGRGDLYAAYYQMEQHVDEQGTLRFALTRLSDYLLLSPQELANHASSLLATNEQSSQGTTRVHVLFCGERSVASQQALRAALPEQSLFVDRQASIRHASMLAALGRQRLQAGQYDDPLLLEPLYLRRPSITASSRKQSLLGPAGPGEQTIQQSAVSPEREEGALHH
jgi:tRNA threonylcarbamoyladenosine biosynthesis protein TsaB